MQVLEVDFAGNIKMITMKKIIFFLLFIPLVSFGQTKDAIEQGIKELQSMIPVNANGMTLVNAVNENDTDLVYVYELQNENSLNIIKNLVNKGTLIKNMMSNNGSQFFITNNIVGVWRYYYNKELIKEIKINPSDYNLTPSFYSSNEDYKLGDFVSFKDLPKSKGVNMQIRKPLGWDIYEGDRPNIVLKFVLSNKRAIFKIENNTRFISKNDAIEIFSDKDYLKRAKNSLKLTPDSNIKAYSSRITTIDSYPSLENNYEIELNYAGNDIINHILFYQIYYEDKIIQLLFTEQLKEGVNEYEKDKFFVSKMKKMVSSVIFPDQY